MTPLEWSTREVNPAAPPAPISRALHTGVKTGPAPAAGAAASGDGLVATKLPSRMPPADTSMRVFWCGAVAMCAAIMCAAIGRFEYHASADFNVSGPIDECRTQCLNLLWRRERDADIEKGWRVAADFEKSRLSIQLVAHDSQSARAGITRVAADVQDEMDRVAKAALHARQEDPTQRALTEIIEGLSAEINSARGARRDTPAPMTDDDPCAMRDQLLADIAENIERVESLRATERDIIDQLRHMENEPATPRIDPIERDEAQAARPELQEDLKEIEVQLRLATRFIQEVWQNTSPRLDELASASAKASGADSAPSAAEDAASIESAIANLSRRAGLYQQRLATFSREWTEAFVRLRNEPVGRDAPRLFACQQRLHDLLGDFSFHSAKLLDDMRDALNKVGERAGDPAANHMLLSETIRNFHHLESEHRRFEFVAADITLRNNFRLESAFKSARGLYRRTQDTMALVEADLEVMARRRAESQRDAALAAAKAELDGTRTGIYAAIERWIALQGDLRNIIPKTEHYVRTSESAAAAQQDFVEMERVLSERKNQLESLRQARAAAPVTPCTVALIGSSWDDWPCDLERRLVIAAAIGILTFGVLNLFSQRRWRKAWD